jgi:translation elongation factor EF-G
MTDEEYNVCKNLKESIENCDSSKDAPVIVYISKMQPINARSLAVATNTEIAEGDKEITKLIGFGRVFSGKLIKGQEIYVFGATHSKTRPDITVAIVKEIFIFMGGDSVKSVSDMNAGNIVGIGGLENIILKMGTLSSCKE